MAWLEEYAKYSGDVMPDSGDIHLPDYRWKHVWTKMYASLRHHGDQPPSLGAFLKNAKATLGHIKIVKVKHFAKCSTCEKLNTLIGKSSGPVREFFIAEKDQHICWQQRERNKYYKHREKARNPMTRDKCLSVAIDSMDHGKTSIPKRPRDDKDTEHCNKLITHVTGVLVHGRDPGALAFTWYDRFPASSDVVNTILLHTIYTLDGDIPPTLYLQLDNCWRENKNKYVLGLCTLLVEYGIFQKVRISFLPKGHTHEDPDQMFSCFHKIYLVNALWSINSLHELGEAAYKPKPKFIHLDEMAAWSSLLRPHLRNIEGISKPRSFRLKRDEEGNVRCHYRMQMQVESTNSVASLDKEWVVDTNGDGAGHDTCKAIHLITRRNATMEAIRNALAEKTEMTDHTHRLFVRGNEVDMNRRLDEFLPAKDGDGSFHLMLYSRKAAPSLSKWMPRNGPGFEVFKRGSRPDISKLVRFTVVSHTH